ncbi:terminase small subunit [Aureimonas psammosilenae]|uniref:terminase small subunit n=1 Tax=Aureimonas psammosilenae TaxID=2495496 RepID=UPI001260E34A|nr:terminase small subunit [Aureimonas psammosilenae]
MTEKQKIFADEYIICLNATRAYKKAYPNVKKDEVARSNGSRLLTNANVKAYIDEQLEKLQSERVADQQEVMEYLTAVMRGKKTEPLLVLDGEGKQKVVDAIPPVQARTKAAELLGKRYRLFTDKQEVEVQGTVVFTNEDDIAD